MKKKMKKAISLLVSLGMLGSMCGTISADNGSEYPEYLNMDGTRRIVKEGYDVTLDIMICRTLDAKGDINDNWFPQFIEQELGINLNIEEVTYDVGAEKKQLQLASGDLPDINFYMGLNANAQAQYGMDEEILLPISDYFSEELTPNIMALLESNPMIEEQYAMPNGKMYTIPWTISAETGSLGRQGNYGDMMCFVNMDYMEAIGRTKDDMPTTLDEFLEMLREIKALDPATMGVDEIIPFVGCDTVEEFIFNRAFGWTNGYGGSWMKPAWDVQADDMVIPALTDKYYDFVDFYRTLYSEGLIHKDWYTLDADSARALVTAGKAAVYSDYGVGDYVSTSGENWFIPNLASEYNDNQAFVPYGSGVGGTHVFCNVDTEYPEVIARLFDYFLSPEGSVYSQYGPPAGSPDCLGIVEGYTIDEETGRVVTPVPEAPAEDWHRDVICLAQCTPRDGNYALYYTYELVGAEAPVDPVYGTLVEGDGTLQYERYQYLLDHDFEYISTKADPILDPDIATELSDMYTLLEDHRAAEVAKFVTGVRPMEEWEDFQAELEELGASEYQQIYADAYAEK